METINDLIKLLGKTTSIDELNSLYNAVVIGIEHLDRKGFFDGDTTFSEVLSTINHIANYNIVRVANSVYEDYEKSGREDMTRLTEIEHCLLSIKEHEDMSIETELLEDICSRLDIAS